MNFGNALEALKNGEALTRQGWAGKGLFVFFVDGDFIEPSILGDKWYLPQDEPVYQNPYFAIKTADGSIGTWVPSVSDCLAEDWEIIERPALLGKSEYTRHNLVHHVPSHVPHYPGGTLDIEDWSNGDPTANPVQVTHHQV